MSELTTVGTYRRIPGDRWIAMGPGVRKLAWAYLGVWLKDLARQNGLTIVEGPVESIEYDEADRSVTLCCEAKAPTPPTPGHLVSRA